MLFTGTPLVTKSIHTCGPNTADVAATSASAVMVADANVRQRPEAISMTGKNTPS